MCLLLKKKKKNHNYKSVRTDLPQQTDQKLIKSTETSEN